MPSTGQLTGVPRDDGPAGVRLLDEVLDVPNHVGAVDQSVLGVHLRVLADPPQLEPDLAPEPADGEGRV